MSAEVVGPIGSVTIAGQNVPFVAIDSLGVRAGFEDWLVEKAYERLRSTRKFRTPAEETETQEGHRRDILGGVYQWGAEQWERAYNTPDGQKKLLHLMFQIADPRYDHSIVDRIYVLPVEEVRKIVDHMFTWGRDPNLNGVRTPATDARTPAT